METVFASLGELCVEIFRSGVDQPFTQAGTFLGPYPSGAPAIFINALAKLGGRCHFSATVGGDDFGKLLIERMKYDGVDPSGIHVLEDNITGIAFTRFHSDGSRSFIYNFPQGAPGRFGPQHLDEAVLKTVNFLHISANVLAFSPSARDACYKAVEIVSSSGGKVSFDPNIRPEIMSQTEIWQLVKPVLDNSYVVLPSRTEARLLMDAEDDTAACQELLARGIPIVALKDSRNGSNIFFQEGQLHIPAFQVEEVDPTGAGDCFDAGIIYGLSQGWELSKCAQFANALGALTVSVQGAMEGFHSLDEVVTFIHETPIVSAKNK